jgi:hypothetical protein
VTSYQIAEDVVVETGGVVQVQVTPTAAPFAAASDQAGQALGEGLVEAGFEIAARFQMRAHPDAALAAASDVANAAVRVRVAANESAVLLVQGPDGLVAWAYGEQAAGGALAIDGGRTLVFALARPPALGVDFGSWRNRLFGWVLDKLTDAVETYVLKFVAGAAIDALLNKLEGDVVSGLVSLEGPSKEWIPGREITIPGADKPILLMCHGTFSSTIGTFAQLETDGPCKAFLNQVRADYGAVLGYDHRTLGATPLENATAFLDAIDPVLPQGATIDAIAFSRGGLVYRTLAETLLASRRPDLKLRKAIFVGCTNGGTYLAEPDNWESLADIYTNAVLGAARAVAVMTGGASVNPFLVMGIKLLGRFVQTVAQVGVTDRRAPGLAAMEPDGEVVRQLNTATSDSSRLAAYYALTSNFEASFEWRNGLSEVAQAALDKVTDQLIGPANDLVVHTPGMTTFGTRQSRLKDTFAIGAQETVFHTVYFKQAVVAEKLGEWLSS